MPFPATQFNINVIASGTPQPGTNLQGESLEVIGSMPPQTGMPIFITRFPVNPPWQILAIDNTYGVVTVGPSGAVSTPVAGLPGMNDQLFYREYPWDVNIWYGSAVGYGWPTGTNCVQFKNWQEPYPTGIGNVRGTDFQPGATGYLRG